MHCQQPAGHHAVLTRTSRSLRTVRTGYTYQEAQGSCCATARTRHVHRTRTSPGRAVRTAYRGTTGTLTKEPLAVEYTYGEDETTRNTFHFHEKYKGRAGFEAHTKAPHFAVYVKFARGRVTSGTSGHSVATARTRSRGARGLPAHGAPPATARRRRRTPSARLRRWSSTKPSRCRTRARDEVLHGRTDCVLYGEPCRCPKWSLQSLGDVPPLPTRPAPPRWAPRQGPSTLCTS